MNNFKKLCNLFYSASDNATTWWAFIAAAAVICIVVGTISGIGSIIYGIITVADDLPNPLPFLIPITVVLMSSALLPPILVGIAKGLGEWIKFATNHNFCPWDNVFNSIVEYIAEDRGHSVERSNVLFSMFMAIAAIIITLMTLSAFLWYVPMFTLLIGALVGLTLISRKTFQVGDKVVNHIKDPDAHKKVDNTE